MAGIPRLRAYEGPALLSYGFRPFFLFGAIYAGLAILVWLPLFEGRIEVASAFTPRDWHVHEMLYGYVPAIVTGFLLTAIPNWTGRLPLQGTPLPPGPPPAAPAAPPPATPAPQAVPNIAPTDTGGTPTVAPSAFTPDSAAGPSVAIATYDPATGQYATPDGNVFRQTDLVQTHGDRSWKDLLPTT